MSDDKSKNETTQALAKKGPVQTLADLLARPSTVAAMRDLIPKHLSPERLTKIALNCVAKTPKLQECSTASVYQSITSAIELGLEPGGPLGHAYLIPRKGVCTMLIGYKGLLELIRRSGTLSNIRAVIVRKGDKFEYEEGLTPRIFHKPIIGSSAPMELVYAVATLKDGSQQFEMMTRQQVESIRDRAGVMDFSPWKTDFDEMARKTALRRISKMLPMSSEVAEALESDGDMVDDFAEVMPSGAEETKKAVRRRLNIADAPPEAPVEEKTETPPEGSTPF